MRPLIIKTTQPMHTPKSTRFVQRFRSFQRNNRVSFGPRGRARGQTTRIIILRRFFTWVFSGGRRFKRVNFLRRFLSVRVRRDVNTFLQLCYAIEGFLPVVLVRMNFCLNLIRALQLVDFGLVFVNGSVVRTLEFWVRPGDIIEVLPKWFTPFVTYFWYDKENEWYYDAYMLDRFWILEQQMPFLHFRTRPSTRFARFHVSDQPSFVALASQRAQKARLVEQRATTAYKQQLALERAHSEQRKLLERGELPRSPHSSY